MAKGREKIRKLIICAVVLTVSFAMPAYAENTAYSGKAETAINIIGVPYSDPDYTHASGSSDVSVNVIRLYDEPEYKELTMAPGDTWFKADTSYKSKIKTIKLDSAPLAEIPSGNLTDSWAADEKGLGSISCFLLQPDTEKDEYDLYINSQLNSEEVPEGECGHIRANEDSSSMFEGFSTVQTITLKGFDTEGCIKMDRMFYGCSSLTSIIADESDDDGQGTVHGFCTAEVLGEGGSSVDMFDGSSMLTGEKGSTLVLVSADDPEYYKTAVYARIDAYDEGDPSSLRGYFSDAPVMILMLHYNDGSGKVLSVPVKSTEDAAETEEESKEESKGTDEVPCIESEILMNGEKKEEQDEEVS